MPPQVVIIAEFQAMMVQLNAVFAQQKALLFSLSGTPVPEPGKVNAHVVRCVCDHSTRTHLPPSAGFLRQPLPSWLRAVVSQL